MRRAWGSPGGPGTPPSSAPLIARSIAQLNHREILNSSASLSSSIGSAGISVQFAWPAVPLRMPSSCLRCSLPDSTG